jgi:MFS family permease
VTPTPSRTATIVLLGIAQTLAWASSYYLPAILAAPMARDLGVSTPTVFAAFSAALVVSALLGPAAGKAIDRHGGRPVLVANSFVFAAGLVVLALAQGPVGLFAGWVILGVAMAAGLYEAAFAALVHLYGKDARGAITGITLFAGFASTVGWPLSAWIELEWGWRATCLAWAALHLLLGLPLNWRLPSSPIAAVRTEAHPPGAAAPTPLTPSSGATRTAVLLALVFAVTWFISTAMAAHLPRLLQAHGVPLATALVFAGLVGPGRRPPAGIRTAAQYPPTGVSAGRGQPAHAGRDGLPVFRRAGRRGVYFVARRRQRRADDCQGHTAAGAVRRARLRRAPGPADGAGALCAGDGAVAVRPGN